MTKHQIWNRAITRSEYQHRQHALEHSAEHLRQALEAISCVTAPAARASIRDSIRSVVAARRNALQGQARLIRREVGA